MFQQSELLSLLKDFHTLTGIRVVLFDENYVERISYPPYNESFCAPLRENPDFLRKCKECEQAAFVRCREQKKVQIYKCHGGFNEAAAEISDNGRTLGYMMFGQITDSPDRDKLFRDICVLSASYGIKPPSPSSLSKIKHKSEEQIRAAAKIMEACAEYVTLKEIVSTAGKPIVDSVISFIENHLSEDLSVDRLCREFCLSRTGLYDVMRPYTDDGISSFIRQKRLAFAKQMVKTTNLPISDIADRSGFTDYNYFLRVFKKQYGVSAKSLRKPF